MHRIFCLILAFVLFSGCGGAKEVPTVEDIQAAVRASWEKKATSFNAATTVEFNSVKIGSGAEANAQDKIDGIPPGRWVTIAAVDFTVWEHASDRTRGLRRKRHCKVYRDQFDEWQVMISAQVGQDEELEKPAGK